MQIFFVMNLAKYVDLLPNFGRGTDMEKIKTNKNLGMIRCQKLLFNHFNQFLPKEYCRRKRAYKCLKRPENQKSIRKHTGKFNYCIKNHSLVHSKSKPLAAMIKWVFTAFFAVV